MIRVHAISLLFVFLIATNSAGLALAANGLNVETRIRAAIGYIGGQYTSKSGVAGFLHGANGISETQRIYSLDNGIVALALAAYQQTHNSEEFYQHLKTSVEFLRQAQTSSGDFYEYFDLATNTWVLSGQLYYWDAYALMGAAYGPGEYAAIGEFPQERQYWADTVNMLRLIVEHWVPRSQLPNGAIVFSFPGESSRVDVAANAAMLSALVHIALFEYFWGDLSLATKYAQWAQLIAQWLHSMQEKDPTSWGRGGFYTNNTQTSQLTFENGFAMFGLNTYFKAVGLFQKTLPDNNPSISELRQTMMNWTEGFVENIVDSWNGPQYGRSAAGVVPYPKQTLDAASILQALVDVWINLGSPDVLCDSPKCYWAEAAKVYNWFAGSNELSIDLQQAKDLRGGSGGFYSGIQKTGAITDSLLATTALTLFGMVKASYIQVPEFMTVTTTTSPTSQTHTSTTNSTSTTTPEKLPWLPAVATLSAIGLLLFVAVLVTLKFRSPNKVHRARRTSRKRRR
jgi:hypothetical protein